MRKRIVPYLRGSMSARDLSRATGVLRLKTAGSRFRPRAGDLIINWGCSNLPNMGAATVLNKGEAVKRAANKLLTFRALAPEDGVPWTTDKTVAQGWRAEGSKVVCRTTLTGHSGQGIIIPQGDDPMPDAPLYTRYVPKKDEYRVHVWRGRVIDFAMKKRRRDMEVSNEYVRSYHLGWVFVRGDVSLPDTVGALALRAITALGLDFGAVDIVVDKRTGAPRVLEINTAPGLTGTTLTRYADAIRS